MWLETPAPFGPRHCGQFVSELDSAISGEFETDKASINPVKIGPTQEDARFMAVIGLIPSVGDGMFIDAGNRVNPRSVRKAVFIEVIQRASWIVRPRSHPEMMRGPSP